MQTNRHRLFIICLLSFFCVTAQAQDYSDNAFTAQIGVSGGVMNCITDLGGKSSVFKTMKPEGGFYIGAFYQRTIGARLEITWGSVTASDANAKSQGVRNRNFSFASDISEISLLAEVHPLDFSPNYNLPVSFYFLAGVGNFSFNPKTKLNGQYVFLQPLHTEGQGFPKTGRPNYKLNQLMLPIGGGLSYEISSLLTVKGELIYRVLNTDYLDDVSKTYINPALFSKNLPANTAALAKELYYRSDEVSNDATAPVGKPRGSSAKDGYYSINLKLELNFGR